MSKQQEQGQAPLEAATPGAEPPHEGDGARFAAARTRRGRIQMLMLLLVCAAPVIASYFAYYVIRPAGGKTNYGTLVEPQRPVPADVRAAVAAALVAASAAEAGKAAADASANAPAQAPAKVPAKWLLITVGDAAQCDDACARRLYVIRQVRLGLNQDSRRMQPVWLITDDAPVSERIRAAYDDAQVGVRFVRVPAASLDAWLGPAAERMAALFLVDPRGNLMMRFPAEPDPSRMLKDLAKLLKWNHLAGEEE